MPISNGSKIWPKILTCTKCSYPVEREFSKEIRIGEFVYSCPSCDVLVSSDNMKWTEEDEVLARGTSGKDAVKAADSKPLPH